MSAEDRTAHQRLVMVERQLKARGISDPRVLEAMSLVPREAFVPPDMAAAAYSDSPLPIGQGQTISQPYVVALMSEALQLEADARVLEIGTGCGYAAAVLAHLAAEVYTIERLEALAARAERTLAGLGLDNVHVRCGDGTLGWPEQAPFDGIVVTAAGPRVPEVLCAQLRVGARLVMPVGQFRGGQQLLAVTRDEAGAYSQQPLGPVSFVPLMGAGGWPEK